MKKLLIAFSGGKTSAYMTKKLIDNLDKTKYEIQIVFANTGKENEETLVFANECDKRWNLDLVWVEAITDSTFGIGVKARVVTFETASRNGEPFEEMIKKHGLPNVSVPICTRELKTYTINAYMRQIGWKKYHRAIGIRIDEVDRINPKYEKERIIYPLVSMFPTTKQEVNKFWMEQDFTLHLTGYNGNCDCCFKKSLRKLLTIAKESPEKFDWWIEMENKYDSYVPETRKKSTPKLPIRIFRNKLSGTDIINMSKEFTDLASDDSFDITIKKQFSLFGNDLDVSNGCSESCEAF